MKIDKDEEEKTEILLKDFIRGRRDLISSLGIFAGLALFSHNFLSGKLGEGISFLFLSGFILFIFRTVEYFSKTKRCDTISLF